LKLLAGILAILACALAIRRHKPVRQSIGGLRCEFCGMPGESFDDFGQVGLGYVRPVRKTFSRERSGGVTQSSEWYS
jgi:hypothetical protein